MLTMPGLIMDFLSSSCDSELSIAYVANNNLAHFKVHSLKNLILYAISWYTRSCWLSTKINISKSSQGQVEHLTSFPP